MELSIIKENIGDGELVTNIYSGIVNVNVVMSLIFKNYA